MASPVELQLYKDREMSLEKQVAELKLELQNSGAENTRVKQKLREFEIAHNKLVEENAYFESLIKQFRDENGIQRENIDNILAKLRETEQVARGSNENRFVVEEQSEELKKARLVAGDMRRQLADKESQLALMAASIEDYKREFERILTDAVRNCKIRLCESLPDMVQSSKVTSHQRTELIRNI